MGSFGVVFTVYFFFASWLRRLRRRAPAGALPLYSAAPCPAPGPPQDPPLLPPTPAALDLSPSLLKMLMRVEKYCRDYGGVCTASNDTLARDWKGPGRPCDVRHVRRLLRELAGLGYIEGWFEPRLCTPENPVGRALRACAATATQRQLELRLGQRRRAQPEELARGYPAATPPPARRRGDPSTPEQGSRGHEARTSMSAGHVRAGGADMSTDLGSEIRSSNGAVNETVTGPGQAAPGSGGACSGAGGTAGAASAIREAAPAPATDANAERLRRHALEMSRRRTIGGLRLFSELHEGAQTCERCKALDAQKEHRLVQGKRVLVGWLFPTVEAAEEAARNHAPLYAAPPDPDDEEDEDEDGPEDLRVHIVEENGQAGYRHTGTGQWVPLDEEAIERALRLDIAIDTRPLRDRPPPHRGGAPPRARPEHTVTLDDDDPFADLDEEPAGAGAGP